VINPSNAEFNPICHLLALLGAHHILHISRVRVIVLCGTGKHVVKDTLNSTDVTLEYNLKTPPINYTVEPPRKKE
jgi:hypothetical protein